MPVPTFTGLPPYPEFQDVISKINKLTQELQNLMLSLDDANFNSITAAVIDVDELSAISANLGTINAGNITSSASINVGTDARIGRYLYLNVSDSSGAKGVVFHDDGTAIAKIDVLSGDISIRSSGFVTLSGAAGSYANGGKIAVEGISSEFSVMGGDGVTPLTLTFMGGTLRSVT